MWQNKTKKRAILYIIKRIFVKLQMHTITTTGNYAMRR